MNIPVTIPDESLDAWNYALELYNAGSLKPLDLSTYINEIIVGAQTNTNVDAYATYQLQQLVPVGVKYIAAPPDVQKQVDTLLAPYAPKD